MSRKRTENIIPKEIVEDIRQVDYTDEMSTSYLDYAVSVITARAIPDVRDGLKPVHRRILWTMRVLGLSSSGETVKSARVVGETMGKYHPHGDASIYDALVHMAQGWYYNHPLVCGQGNFGSVEGDEAAASRYTECKLSKITEDILLSDLDKNIVDMSPNFDNSLLEPTVLPAAIPNILISGTDGIAVGMASKMPSHNLGEVIDAAVALLENPKLKQDDLMKYIKGPDFATGGVIINMKDLPEIYRTGAGKIRVRGTVKTEPGERGKTNIVITEIPFTMIGSIDKFMNTVAELSRSKVMPDVTDIKNFSGRDGIRIVIELRKDADVQQNINLLYKKAKLEDTYGYNATLLSNGVPAQMSLYRIISEFLEFYRSTQTRKYRSLLEKEKKTAEIKEGLIKAIDCVDTIIEVLRGSKTVAQAKACLTKGKTEGISFKTKSSEKLAAKLCFSGPQADAILEMKMQRLIGLELDALTKELERSKKNIELYSGYLSSKTKMSHHLRDNLLEIKSKYAVPRKTAVIDAEEIVLKAPVIKEEQTYALLNRFGYIKLIDQATYDRNKVNLGDYKYVVPVMNVGKMYVFTESGQCLQIKASAVPVCRFNDKGVPLEQVSALSKDDTVISFVSNQYPKAKLLFVTKNGLVKRTAVSEFDSSRKTIDATKLNENDRLVSVIQIPEQGSAYLLSHNGYGVTFDPNSLSPMKRNAAGVIGMKLNKNDYVEYVSICSEKTVKYSMKDGAEIEFSSEKFGRKGSFGKLLLS